MPLPISELTPERKAELLRILDEPFRDPKSMTSLDRLLRINLYKEMRTGGIEVPEEHLSYAIELLVCDRTDRSTAAAAEKKIAKKASTGPVAEPSALDL